MGFSDQSLNDDFKRGLSEIITDKLICCCSLMKKDCLSLKRKIDNDEVKIRNRLLEKYLEDNNIRTQIGLDKLELGFIPEGPENNDEETDTYIGRVDIKVIGKNWFQNTKKYYVIECKRIDGRSDLNTAYVKEGGFRFVADPAKYKSYNKKNFMLAFVVKDINISENAIKINNIQSKFLKDRIISGLSLLQNNMNESFVFLSSYNTDGDVIELEHIFYNLSAIINETKKASNASPEKNNKRCGAAHDTH
jgi:hypothetical protein